HDNQRLLVRAVFHPRITFPAALVAGNHCAENVENRRLYAHLRGRFEHRRETRKHDRQDIISAEER
ncbi:hypothetical protein ACCT30_49585, partial [Rhizobium ruizarguesonis]